MSVAVREDPSVTSLSGPGAESGQVQGWFERSSAGSDPGTTMTVGWDVSDASVRELFETAQLSGTERALDQVGRGLAGLALPPGVAQGLLSALACAAVHDTSSTAGGVVPDAKEISDSALVSATLAVRTVQGFAEGVMLSAAGTLTHRAGVELLARQGVGDPGELSATARQRWRAKAKSVVAQELAAGTGYGIQSCHDRVGVALAPRKAVGVVHSALAGGGTDWRGVSEFWSRCRGMDADQAGEVAAAVFGPLLPGGIPEDQPDTSDADPRRESWAQFHRRLDREVTRVEGADAKAERARRKAAVDARDVHGRLCDDGTGQFTIHGPATSIVAALERVESVARKARKGGDERPLRHIRSDTALALLVHGTLPLPSAAQPTPAEGHEVPDGHEPLVGCSADVARILTGTPPAAVEVIVPITTLAHINHYDGDGDVARILGDHGPGSDHESGTPRGGGIEEGDTGSRHGGDLRQDPADEPFARGAESGVAEIIGHGFLTGEHARQIVCDPGTVLHRLLTDPADGRLVERGISAYRPDAAMLRQLRAADVTCRAPGCQTTAHRCEVDHETPHGDGGVTTEVNLNHKHPPHHQSKTERLWASMMDSTRVVTWTSFFGRIYPTRGHDYTQYSGPGSTTGQARHDPLTISDPDVRNRLVYAALSSRDGQDSWLAAIDDEDTGAWVPGYYRPIDVFHRSHGRRRHGPPADQPTVEDLLLRPPQPPERPPTEWAAAVDEAPPF